MFHVIFYITLFVYFIETNNLRDYIQSTALCDLGERIENKCIKCVCTSKNIFNCTIQDCSDNIRKKYNFDSKTPKCNPNKIYIQNTTTCICSNKGNWPHEKCSEIFGILRSNTSKRTCQPNSYVTNDCNVCRCNSKGEIDDKRCTRNTCPRKQPLNSRKSSYSYGKCQPKLWYSPAPCKFCYCVNENKLVCNKGNFYTQYLELANYNLSVCEGDIISEAKKLVSNIKNDLRIRKPNKLLIETTTEINLKAQGNKELIEGNDRKKETGTNSKVNDQGEEEPESEGEEQEIQEKVVKIGRDGAVTQIPYQEYENDNKEKWVESDFKTDREENSDSDNELSVDIEEFTPKRAEDNLFKINDNFKLDSLNNLAQDLGRSIKLNLPDILNNLLNKEMRKSMVSLTADTNCVPGSAKLVQCNMCYCLKNSKLLCTKNKC